MDSKLSFAHRANPRLLDERVVDKAWREDKYVPAVIIIIIIS